MSNERIKSSLSAMMDNEANELEVRRVLADADEESLATWSRYQVARSLLRNEVVFPKLDIASAVSEAIVKETEAAQPLLRSESKRASGFWQGMGKFATATTILAVALSTVFFFSDDGTSESASNIYASNGDGQGSSDVALSNPQADKKVVELLKKHEKQGLLLKEEIDLKSKSRQ